MRALSVDEHVVMKRNREWLLREDCPPAPEGYHWDHQHDGSPWRHLVHDNAARYGLLWGIRDNGGKLYIGPLDYAGYEITQEDDLSVVVVKLLAIRRMGIGERLP